jgi:Bardet-Biedl syndrome 5 protein
VSSTLQNVEDVKGNPGERGTLIVSNLRLIWFMHSNKESNISIGYDAITRIEKKIQFLPNSVTKFYINMKAVRSTSRYEFQFASLSEEAHAVYDLVLKYHKYVIVRV